MFNFDLTNEKIYVIIYLSKDKNKINKGILKMKNFLKKLSTVFGSAKFVYWFKKSTCVLCSLIFGFVLAMGIEYGFNFEMVLCLCLSALITAVNFNAELEQE